MGEIIPAILPKTVEELSEQAKLLPSEISFVHIDALEEDIWAPINKAFEAHLMVEHPEGIIGRWVERGAKRVITHKIDDDILKYRGKAEIGLGFELHVPIEEVLTLATFADFVHIMSISEIGEQGHSLDARVFDRIKQVQEKFPDLPISVDGGITVENYEKLLEAGADRLVIGSHFKEVWNSLKKG